MFTSLIFLIFFWAQTNSQQKIWDSPKYMCHIDGTLGPCLECECNGNVDESITGNCDTRTGECLNCGYNTFGPHCENCLPGYYGNALAIPKGDCRECQCHPKGTRESSVFTSSFSYKKSAFICDQVTGQCKCKDYVEGIHCDKCVDGFWKLYSGEGCIPCECDPIGSINKTCRENDGQCFCKSGVTGKKCTQCLPFYYGFSDRGCERCDCDPVGSRSPQCKENGQCNCILNLEGKRCDKCRENTYDKHKGCIDCPPCYKLIQDYVNMLRTKLNELHILLENIIRNPSVVQDANFETQLQEALNKVTDLLRQSNHASLEGQDLENQLIDLKLRIERVQQVAAQTNIRLDDISTLVIQGTQNMSIAEDLIKRAEEALYSTERLLETEGFFVLRKAKERSEMYGQQSARMSEIANQARELAKVQEEQAEAIENLSKEALSSSNEAYKLAKNAVLMQESNVQTMQKVRAQLADTRDLLERTKKMAYDSKIETIRAYEDSLTLYSEINSLNFPTFESDRMRQEAMDLIGKAKRIMEEADEIINRYRELFNKTQYQIQQTHFLIVETIRQQNNAQALFIEVDLAKDRAMKAVQAATATLDEARETLNTLLKFDEVVKTSKARSEEALKKIPEIERLVKEAQEKTKEAKIALDGAQTNALEAKDIALEAKANAEEASQNANRISQAAIGTKEKLRQLKQQTSILIEMLRTTETRITKNEQQLNNDEKLANEVLEKANQAETSAREARKKVELTLHRVENIMLTLDGLKEGDGKLLDELEQKLAQAEREYIEANLANRTAALQKARDNQIDLMKNYESELEKLRKDVENIKLISEALPLGCYGRSKLEP